MHTIPIAPNCHVQYYVHMTDQSKIRTILVLSRNVNDALHAECHRRGCTMSAYADSVLAQGLGLGATEVPVKACRKGTAGPEERPVVTSPVIAAPAEAPKAARATEGVLVTHNKSWLGLEMHYREMLRWWPGVGTPQTWVKLGDLIADAHRATREVGPDGTLVRPSNLWQALQGMCRARGDEVSVGKLGAALRAWRGHWRDGRAVQRWEDGRWGVVRRGEW